MGRTLRILVPCALGLIAAFLVSCGDTSKLIPGDEAAAINQNVDAAAEASGSGRCGRADAAVARAAAHVQQLPSGVDPRLRADLEQGLARLRAAAATECAQNKEPTTTTTETTPSTESTASTETQNTQTENTETQNTQTENTETQNTETQGTDTTGGSGGGSGGGGAGSGGTSGGASNGQGSDGGNGGTAAP